MSRDPNVRTGELLEAILKHKRDASAWYLRAGTLAPDWDAKLWEQIIWAEGSDEQPVNSIEHPGRPFHLEELEVRMENLESTFRMFMEETQKTLVSDGNEVRLNVNPFEIATVRIVPA